ncbi:MAG: hypothetical protein Q9210_005919 [Variospora velana]
MTTAHRPTFDPPGQGGDADAQPRDLRAQLLEAEAAHFSKTDKVAPNAEPTTSSGKRQLEAGPPRDGNGEEDIEAKRRRVLEESRDVDADSDHSNSSSSEEDSDDEEDETAELLRELEKIKKERAEKQAQEERVKAEAEQEDRERDIALGNPLLNPHQNNDVKRRWDDDVVFRNQARGTENKGKKEFVNDLLRSDFHKRFMIWTLFEKDLLVAAERRPISTFIRALLLPLAIVLTLSYAQYFFNPPQHFGISTPSAVLNLSDAIASSSGGRNKVAFIDNGFANRDISGVIEELATPFCNAGMSVHQLANESDLFTTCPNSQRGTTSCFGAVAFHSSPNEPVAGGDWNYTIRSDISLGGTFGVRSATNDAQVFLLPLQRAVDQAITSSTPSADPAALGEVQQYVYTKNTEEERVRNTRMNYFDNGTAYFRAVFFLGMVGVVYHMVGSIATEREHGLSQLIDAMMPNRNGWNPQLARIFAHHAAFSIIYLPSWCAIGIILASVIFELLVVHSPHMT